MQFNVSNDNVMVYESDVIGFTETTDIGVVSATFTDDNSILFRDVSDASQLTVGETYEFVDVVLPAIFSIAVYIQEGWWGITNYI